MNKRTLSLVVPVLIVLALLAGSGSIFAQGPAGSGSQAVSPTGTGVYGTGNIGVAGESSGWLAVYGANTSTDTTSAHVGVAGETYGTDIANRNSVGVQGLAVDPGGGIGVRGRTNGMGIGVLGESLATTGYADGVFGQVASDTGKGVVGVATATSGYTRGVYGQSDSTDGYGVYGFAPGGTGVYGDGNIGVEGESSGWLAVYGTNTSTDTTSAHIGVAGETAGSDVSNRNSVAVQGYATNPAGGIGVRGLSAGVGIAVLGESQAASGAAYGVYGISASTDGAGVHGEGRTGTEGVGTDYGVYGSATSSAGTGVQGIGHTGVMADGVANGVVASGDTYGVFGWSTGTGGDDRGVFGRSDSSIGSGVYGYASAGTGSTYGVYGFANADDGIGVGGFSYNIGVYGYGNSTSGISVYGAGQLPGWAGYFNGQVQVTGNLFKGGGGFKIDDPLDPAHKYLYHSFVESPDMMNIYNGIVTLGQDGTAWVDMPDWFQAVNQDFRYQLTCIGGYAPVYIAHKVEGNRFRIGGGMPGLEVSWQVTGVRHDPWAEANRIPVEQAKPASEQGTYLHPELYGQPASAGVDYGKRPAGQDATPAPVVQPR